MDLDLAYEILQSILHLSKELRSHIPTIWTDGKAEVGRVREGQRRSEKRREEKRRGEERRGEEKKREDQRRESLRRKKNQVREKVGKSRNSVFFQ